jgi:hypothetical protein
MKVFLKILLMVSILFISSQATLVYAAPSFFDPKCSANSCPFTFLAPIGFSGFGQGGVLNVAGNGATTYLKNLYVFGVAIAAVLAVIMITWGGVEYSTTDAIGGKSEGREKIKAAITGLILALLSYTILNTINPYLVYGDFSAKQIKTDAQIGNVGVNATPSVEQIPSAAGGGTSAGAVGGGNIPSGPAAQRMEQAAISMLGKETCFVSNTGDGRRACAYVVNNIIDDALGTPINGSHGNTDSYGRGTREMYETLRSSSRFTLVGSDTSQLRPGDIIISPTTGSVTGHVGIYTSSGNIISNSSSRTEVDDHFSPSSWTNTYGGKGLNTHIFRANP